MALFDQALMQQLQAFATSLAIGLLMGLERERHVDTRAGLRTFALVAMLGNLSALIDERLASGWIVAAGLLAVGGMMIVSIATDPSKEGDPGTTSVVALMVSFGLGVAVGQGHGTLAAMLGIAATTLLYFKAELHGFTHNLTPRDLTSILQFAILTFVILPILPDRDFGPYDALNPHQIWWMVVLISGVSLAGYAALRFVGARYGAALIGFFGGMVSSTATTMVFARHARGNPDLARTATVVILLASLVVMLRLELLSIVVAPAISISLAVVLGSGLLLGLAVAAWSWRGFSSREVVPMPDVRNPTEIRTALTFGLLYALILFLAAWLGDIAGTKGLYAVALASGLADVDAITLSTLRLYNQNQLDAGPAVISIALAIVSNLVFKAGLVVAIGGGQLARRVLPGLAAIGCGIGGAIWLIA